MTDDYTPQIRGGLKLKGSFSTPSGIKKKKKSRKTDPSTSTSTTLSHALEREKEKDSSMVLGTLDGKGNGGRDNDKEKGDIGGEDLDLHTLEQKDSDGKTASERAREEMRRKRLADRLSREGPKTHKQRVEEFNKALSNLSEHHDMPRIGPG